MGRVKVLTARSFTYAGNTGYLFALTPGTMADGDDTDTDVKVTFDWALVRDPNTGTRRAVANVLVIVPKTELEAI